MFFYETLFSCDTCTLNVCNRYHLPTNVVNRPYLYIKMSLNTVQKQNKNKKLYAYKYQRLHQTQQTQNEIETRKREKVDSLALSSGPGMLL